MFLSTEVISVIGGGVAVKKSGDSKKPIMCLHECAISKHWCACPKWDLKNKTKTASCHGRLINNVADCTQDHLDV